MKSQQVYVAWSWSSPVASARTNAEGFLVPLFTLHTGRVSWLVQLPRRREIDRDCVDSAPAVTEKTLISDIVQARYRAYSQR